MSMVQKFPSLSREQWLSRMEKRAMSDAAIRKNIADYKNMQVGIATATSNLVNPITKAVTEASDKQIESQKQSARKQFLATNSAAVDQALLQKQAMQISKDNVKKMKKLAAVMNTYIGELKKGKPSDKQDAILTELADNAIRTQSILDHIEKQKVVDEDLNKTIDLEIEVDELKRELEDRERIIRQYKEAGGREATGLEVIQEAEEEVLNAAIISEQLEEHTMEPSTTKPKFPEATSLPTYDESQKEKKKDIKKKGRQQIADKASEIAKQLGEQEYISPEQALASYKTYSTRSVTKTKSSDKPSNSGNGLSPAAVKDVNRIQVLLASNNAGNDSGIQEFLRILKKLLRQKIISRTDYNRFIESWRK